MEFAAFASFKLMIGSANGYFPPLSLSLSRLDLTPMDYYPDAHPALHLVVYSVNQKGRSEPIVLENVPINEADKRSGELMKSKKKVKIKENVEQQTKCLSHIQSLHCGLSPECV